MTQSFKSDNNSNQLGFDAFESVVKIFAVACTPYYSQPWEMEVQSSSYSSGFMIKHQNKNKILCNAHGVSNITQIRVRKHGDSKKYNAKLEYIGHECDLALLVIEPKSSDEFWENTQTLSFYDGNVKLQDKIVCIGC